MLEGPLDLGTVVPVKAADAAGAQAVVFVSQMYEERP